MLCMYVQLRCYVEVLGTLVTPLTFTEVAVRIYVVSYLDALRVSELRYALHWQIYFILGNPIYED